MKILRATLKLHKWIALLVGIQIFIWVGTGIYFTIFPLEEIRGNHKKTQWDVQPFESSEIIPLEKALAIAGANAVERAELGHMMGRPVWRLNIPGETGSSGKMMTVDGKTGQLLTPITEALAIQLAKSDYNGPGQFSKVTFLENPPGESGAGGAPRWAAQFEDGENTTLYIDPHAAKVTTSRSNKWRIFDFFFKLHVMDYDDGEDFHSWHLRLVSLIAMLVVLSGFTLLFFRIRRLLKNRRRRRNKSS